MFKLKGGSGGEREKWNPAVILLEQGAAQLHGRLRLSTWKTCFALQVAYNYVNFNVLSQYPPPAHATHPGLKREIDIGF